MDEAREVAARGRRQAAEQVAWEIGQRERDRLARDGLGDLAPRGWGRGDAGGPGGWGGTPGDLRGGLPPVGADHPDDDPDVPPALRLLRRLPGPAWQMGVGVALLAVPALLFVAWPPGGVVLGALVLLAFTPARWRSRRDW
jgi:hypothetical protein